MMNYKIKITFFLFCTLALSACGDSGEASLVDPSVLPTVDEPGDFLGDNGAGGIVGDAPENPVVDVPEDIIPADPTDLDTDTTDLDSDTTDLELTPVDDVVTTDDVPVVEDTTVDDGMLVEDSPTFVPPVTGGLFILPGDCALADGDNGMRFCISEAAGSRLFAVDENDSLVFSATLSDQGSNTDPIVIGGDGGAFVVRQSVATSNNRILTSFDENGNELYEALLSGDLITVVDGIVETPNLFLHTTNSFGDSSILQIDSASGRQNSVLNLPGVTVGDIDVESFDGITALSIVMGGVTVFHDLNTLEPITRIFTLDPTNFQQTFSAQMNTLRGDYLFDFEAILNATIAMFEVGAEETEMTVSYTHLTLPTKRIV